MGAGRPAARCGHGRTPANRDLRQRPETGRRGGSLGAGGRGRSLAQGGRARRDSRQDRPGARAGAYVVQGFPAHETGRIFQAHRSHGRRGQCLHRDRLHGLFRNHSVRTCGRGAGHGGRALRAADAGCRRIRQGNPCHHGRAADAHRRQSEQPHVRGALIRGAPAVALSQSGDRLDAGSETADHRGCARLLSPVLRARQRRGRHRRRRGFRACETGGRPHARPHQEAAGSRAFPARRAGAAGAEAHGGPVARRAFADGGHRHARAGLASGRERSPGRGPDRGHRNPGRRPFGGADAGTGGQGAQGILGWCGL